jgi:hypothetical protein
MSSPERLQSAGDKVNDLYTNQKLSAGYYTVPFDGAGLPSGTYFYKLTTSGPNHHEQHGPVQIAVVVPTEAADPFADQPLFVFSNLPLLPQTH